MRKESLEFLKELLACPSPSGYETNAQKIWCDYARKYADEVRTDSYGNAVAVLNPDGDPKIMLDGHVDELGLMVKHIDDNGFLYFQNIGGVDPALLRGKRVIIHNEKGEVKGVIGSVPVHLQNKEKEKKQPKIHECFIDIGAADQKAASRRVAVGDPVSFTDDFELLHDDICVARGLDDRIGTWIVLETLRIAAAAKSKPKCAIYACSSVQEEVGLFGAAMSVFNVRPDAAIIAEVTHSTDVPGIDAKQHGQVKLGQGPTVSIGRENHPLIVSRLKKIASRKKIKLQNETFSLRGGTDALAIFTKHGGVPTAVVGVPNRYMHTTVEMLDLNDAEKAAQLLAAFATDLKKGERFKVNV